MTHHEKSGYAAIIEEMRRLTRSRFESSGELQQLRSRLKADRVATEQKVLEAIAEQAHVDLKAIVEKARGPRDKRRQDVAETLTRLDAKARRVAKDERARFHQVRARYRADFQGQVAGATTTTQLKFHDVIYSSGDANAGACTYFGSGLFSPWIGPDATASADITPGTNPDGTWLHPKIDIDANSCDDVRPGTTFQDLTYHMAAPVTSFGVDSIRVDLIANGVAISHFGDVPFLATANPEYLHTLITMDAYLAQLVNGEWGLWPVASETLLEGRGDYVRQVRSLLSGQTYGTNLFIRGADTGGGDLLCLVQVACSTTTIGTDYARASINFGASDGLGIFLGGVAMIGASA